MENKQINLDDNNAKINSMISKLANAKDIELFKNKIKNFIEENNNRIFISIKNDKKDFLLLRRTFYLNIFDKIEKIINNEEIMNPNFNLQYDKYLRFLSYFNLLLDLEDLYINKVDIFRSLQLQSKIINIIKKYFINKIG